MRVTSDDYIERTAGYSGEDGEEVYLNLMIDGEMLSFGPWACKDDALLPFYRLMTSDGPILMEDALGADVLVSVEDVESVVLGSMLAGERPSYS